MKTRNDYKKRSKSLIINNLLRYFFIKKRNEKEVFF